MKDRILEFLRNENKTSAQFAEEIHVQPSGISHILSGRNKPSLDFVLKMLERYPFLSVEWLLFGQGSMYREAKMAGLFSEAEMQGAVKEADRTERSDEKEVIPSGSESVTDGGTYEKVLQDQPGVIRIVCFYDDYTFTEYQPRKR